MRAQRHHHTAGRSAKVLSAYGRGDRFALRLARLPSFALGRLFKVTGAFDVPGETFTHAKALEPLEKLLDGLVGPRSNLYHVTN